MLLLVILIVLVVLALGGGAWGHPRYGYVGWSPLGIVLVVLVGLWLTGNLGTCQRGVRVGATDTLSGGP